MITFYYNLAPNPMKVALFLEEAGLDYEAVPVDSRRRAAPPPAVNGGDPPPPRPPRPSKR